MKILLTCVCIVLWSCSSGSVSKNEAAKDANTLRVISTSPSTTELLFALGVGENVVGVTRFCDYPKEVLSLPKIGGFTDLNLEKIISLRPTLVVGARNGSNRRIVEHLNSLGIQTVFPPDKTLEEIFDSIQAIANAVGKISKGRALAASLKSRLETIRKQTETLEKPSVLFVVGVEPIIVAGKGTFADTLIRYAGGENVVKESISEYPTYDMEAVLRSVPEVIIDASSESGSRIKARWADFSEIPAVAKNRVYTAPSSALLRPGPRLSEGLVSLVTLLHPDLDLPFLENP